MTIKTIATANGINVVDFGDTINEYYWCKNLGDTTIYVSNKEDFKAGDDGVSELTARGDITNIEATDGKVYILGTGKVEIHNTRSKLCPFRNAPAKSGGGDTVTISNPNLLINPDFRINQRGVSGTKIPDKNADGEDIHTYFVDRWGIDSGSVTINADGTLTLNGTISQIFENADGDNVTASIGVVSGTATANYDDTVKKFSITGDNAVISWAKLEHGKTATPFIPPDPVSELAKCQRYYQIIDSGSPMFGIVINSTMLRLTMSMICPMRKKPTMKMLQHTGDFTWSFTIKNAAATSLFITMDFSEMSATLIRTDGATMNVYIGIPHTLSSGEIVYTGGSGGIYFALDAEI